MRKLFNANAIDFSGPMIGRNISSQLFTALDAVHTGDTVEVSYKRRIIHLHRVQPESKFSRLVRQPVFAPGGRKWKSELRRELSR